MLRALSENRKSTYRLHLDIHRYFLSIHRPTLFELFTHRLRDEKTLDLIENQLEQGGQVYDSYLARYALKLKTHPRPNPESGIAIGAYLSQWSGSLYLNGLDHFVTRHLQPHGYLRYMDDLLLFANSVDALLSYQEAIAEWLHVNRNLELNSAPPPETTSKPFVYLGYRVHHGGIDVGPKLTRRLSKNLRKAARKNPDTLERCEASYRGLLLFGTKTHS